jgi:O-methyltransferase involved in polyketide biosynthesis
MTELPVAHGEGDSLEWPPAPLDLRTPAPARMYDYYLGGKDNFQVDRDAAEQVIRIYRDMPLMARENRRFLRRAVSYLVSTAGIRQFLDLGAGLPTQGNVHEIAHSIDRDVRVLYVDNDPMVVVHGRALLASEDTVTVAKGDLRNPEEILDTARDFLDLDQPVAVLMSAILHYLPDEADPWAIVARFREAIAPGSYLAVSHITADHNPEAAKAAEGVYRYTTAPMTFRSYDQVVRFFDGFELIEPGVTVKSLWHPHLPEGPPVGTAAELWGYSGIPRGVRDQWGYAGVGFKK